MVDTTFVCACAGLDCGRRVSDTGGICHGTGDAPSRGSISTRVRPRPIPRTPGCWPTNAWRYADRLTWTTVVTDEFLACLRILNGRDELNHRVGRHINVHGLASFKI